MSKETNQAEQPVNSPLDWIKEDKAAHLSTLLDLTLHFTLQAHCYEDDELLCMQHHIDNIRRFIVSA